MRILDLLQLREGARNLFCVRPGMMSNAWTTTFGKQSMHGKTWQGVAHGVDRNATQTEGAGNLGLASKSGARPSFTRPIPSLADDVLHYWHKTLISDDVQGMSKAEFRFAVPEPKRFGWPNFTLGFTAKDKTVLAELIAHARAANRLPSAPAAPENGEDDEQETDDEPVMVEDRVPMALVLCHSSVTKSSSISPGLMPAGAKAPYPLDIVFWMPFMVDEDGKLWPPREADDTWPRIVRQWLDPQPASDRDLAEPVGHLDTYRDALGDLMADPQTFASFADYAKASLRLFRTICDSSGDCGYAIPHGHWMAVPRTPGYAVRHLSQVYTALHRARVPSALEQVLGQGDPARALDPEQPLSNDT